MPTIKELKEQYQVLQTERDDMLKGQDIWSDTWDPSQIILADETDPVAKSRAYIKKCQDLKAVEDALVQAEEMRKQASVGIKSLPADSEYKYQTEEPSALGIKSTDDLRAAISKMQKEYKETGKKTHDFRFHHDFLKATVVAAGTQARMPGQEISIPAYPTTDILSIATWYPIVSNMYTKYEVARGVAAAQRAEGGTIVDLNPTVPQRNFILQNTGGFIDMAAESLDDLGQLEMNMRELIDLEIRRNAALQAAAGDNTGNNWNGLATQITNSGAIAANTGILTYLREQLISAMAAGNPYNYFLADADTVGKLIESLDRRGYGQYDRTAYPMGIYLGCVAVPMTQLPTNNALLIASDHLKIVHKGDVSVMMSEDVEFKSNVVTLRGTMRGNLCYSYPTTEGRKATTTNNFIIEADPQG